MGMIPIFLMIASFFFLWGGVIYFTFRQYRTRALEAIAARKEHFSDPVARLHTIDLLAQGREGQLPTPAWQAEYAYRAARHSYHKLLSKAPYSVFAKWFGFKPLG
jgi:hypothetical protein